MKKHLNEKSINKLLEELQRVLAKYGFELKEFKRMEERIVITAEKWENSKRNKKLN